jgi:dolichol kinase
MNQRSREFWRKIAHMLIGTACVSGAYVVLQEYGSGVLDLVLGSVLAALVLCDVLIADYGWKLPLYHQLQRPHEERGLHAATLGFIGGVLAYKLFLLPAAIAAIGMLIYGDAAAAIAGLLAVTGKKKATAARIATMFLVSAAIGLLLLGWIGVAMAVVATLAEAYAAKIDDSLTIPLLAGLAGELLLRFFLR